MLHFKNPLHFHLNVPQGLTNIAYSFLALLGEGPKLVLMHNIVQLLHNSLYFTLGSTQWIFTLLLFFLIFGPVFRWWQKYRTFKIKKLFKFCGYFTWIKTFNFQMMIKTRTSRIEELTEFVKSNHPYEVCEVITTSIEKGNRPYLDWIGSIVPEKRQA